MPSPPGLVARQFFSGQDEETQEQTLARLEGIGFGFLVPIFFVVSGIRFELDALLSGGSALLLLPISLVLFLIVRGVPTYAALRGSLSGRDRVGAGIYTATALPLVVVITSIGVERGELDRSHRGSTGRRGHVVGAGVPPGSDPRPAGRTGERRGVE